MLQIILLILKVIGIVLLSIIGLLLFMVMLVLFVPVRYRGILHYHDELTAQVRISWLLHIISVRVIYEENELKRIIRIFGIPLKKREKKQKTKQKDQPAYKAAVQEHTEEREDCIEDRIETKNPEEQTEAVKEIVSEKSVKNEIPKAEKKPTLLEKWKQFVKMLYDFFHKIQYTFRNIYDKIDEIKGKIEYYSDFLQDEHNRNAFTLLLGQAGGLLRHVKPRRFRADLKIGTEDPATTGTILAVLGIIYPFFNGGMHITPFYDRTVFEADTDLRGRVTAVVFLKTAWTVYFDKDFKRLLNTFRNKEAA